MGAMLTDNGREFCGKRDSQPIGLLALDGVDHGAMKVWSPQANSFVGRITRALLGECFRVEGHKICT